MKPIKDKILETPPPKLYICTFVVQIVLLYIFALSVPIEQAMVPGQDIPNFLHIYCILFTLFLWIVEVPLSCLGLWAAKRTKVWLFRMLSISFAITFVGMALIFTVGVFGSLVKLVIGLL